MVYSSNMLHTEVENSVMVDKIQSKKVSSLEIKKKEKKNTAGKKSQHLNLNAWVKILRIYYPRK